MCELPLGRSESALATTEHISSRAPLSMDPVGPKRAAARRRGKFLEMYKDVAGGNVAYSRSHPALTKFGPLITMAPVYSSVTQRSSGNSHIN